MNHPLSSDGLTEQSAFDGYMLQVFTEHQHTHFYLSSNSDLFTCGSSVGDLISAQHLISMFAELQEEFSKDRIINSTLLNGFSEGWINYSEQEPFVTYAEKDGIFIAIVGFASPNNKKNLQDDDCFRVDSELFVWADVQKYEGDINAFCEAVEQYAITNDAGVPSRYKTSEGAIDYEGYSSVIQHTVDGVAQQYPPYYNHARHFENGQPKPQFMMGFQGRQARLEFLRACATPQHGS